MIAWFSNLWSQDSLCSEWVGHRFQGQWEPSHLFICGRWLKPVIVGGLFQRAAEAYLIAAWRQLNRGHWPMGSENKQGPQRPPMCHSERTGPWGAGTPSFINTSYSTVEKRIHQSSLTWLCCVTRAISQTGDIYNFFFVIQINSYPPSFWDDFITFLAETEVTCCRGKHLKDFPVKVAVFSKRKLWRVGHQTLQMD